VPVFDCVGENDFVPDEKIFITFLKMLQELINLHKLIVGSDIETGPFPEQRFDYLLIWVCLYRIITLNSRQILFESSVILPYFGVVDNKQRSPVSLS
jgi:hypothetical protein